MRCLLQPLKDTELQSVGSSAVPKIPANTGNISRYLTNRKWTFYYLTIVMITPLISNQERRFLLDALTAYLNQSASPWNIWWKICRRGSSTPSTSLVGAPIFFLAKKEARSDLVSIIEPPTRSLSTINTPSTQKLMERLCSVRSSQR